MLICMASNSRKKPSTMPTEDLPLEDPTVTPEKVREFKRGNINFDFLQPEGSIAPSTSIPPQIDRRGTGREGKRGLFNRGREARPVGAWHIAGFSLLFLACISGIALAFWSGQSILLLLLTPLLALGAAWSMLMLILFKVRPG